VVEDVTINLYGQRLVTYDVTSLYTSQVADCQTGNILALFMTPNKPIQFKPPFASLINVGHLII